jgi:tetratricopeptide (TPR) repeat protein
LYVGVLSDKAVIAILVFLALLILFVSIRYDEEIRALFGRLERFRADKKGIESTFSPAGTRDESASPGRGAGPAPVKESSELPNAQSVEEDLNLQPETDRESLRAEMLRAVFAKEDGKAKQALSRLTETSSDPVETEEYHALFDAAVFDRDGDPEILKRLRERAKDPRLTAHVENLTGLVLENVKRPTEAAEAYKAAYEAAEKPALRASTLAARARLLADGGQAEKAERELKGALADMEDPDARSKIWRALAKTYDARRQYFKKALALQEARQHEPNDADLCFEIAWALSQSEREDVRPLAIFFYRLAVYLEPKHQWALNNLGWEFSKANLRVEAARYYKKAAALGNTLAMANLAGMKQWAGFVDEAEELLKKAQEQEDVHDNVAGVMVDVSRKRTEQSAKAKELDELGGRLAEFCSELTQGESDDVPTSIPDVWKWDGEESVAVDVREGKLELLWTEGNDRLKVEADLTGRSGNGTFYRMGHRFSILQDEREETGWEKQKSVLVLVDDHGRGIRVAFLSEDQAAIKKLEAQE